MRSNSLLRLKHFKNKFYFLFPQIARDIFGFMNGFTVIFLFYIVWKSCDCNWSSHEKWRRPSLAGKVDFHQKQLENSGTENKMYRKLNDILMNCYWRMDSAHVIFSLMFHFFCYYCKLFVAQHFLPYSVFFCPAISNHLYKSCSSNIQHETCNFIVRSFLYHCVRVL